MADGDRHAFTLMPSRRLFVANRRIVALLNACVQVYGKAQGGQFVSFTNRQYPPAAAAAPGTMLPCVLSRVVSKQLLVLSQATASTHKTSGLHWHCWGAIARPV